MDAFTNSLNSQMRMLELNGQQEVQNKDPSKLALQVNNNYSLEFVSTGGNGPASSFEGDPLPNDVESLKNLLAMRIKYTRPKQGGLWELNNVPDDVNFLQNCIRFIDKNHATGNEFNMLQNQEPLSERNYYDRFLEPLEMTAKELDTEFGFRFFNHFSHKVLRKELVKIVKSSEYDYLANVLSYKRVPGEAVPKSWRIYPRNEALRQIDYIRYYDTMDANFKEWILNYCISNVYTRELCMNSSQTTYDILNTIERSQNVSFQLKLLIDILIENSGSDEYLSDEDNFLPYLTYVDHLEMAIKTSIPSCKNPYRVAMLLLLVIRGMTKFPQLLSEFQIRLEEFLTKYPDFTLGQLGDFLKQNHLPNVGGVQRLLN